jgi:hypothetical protein
MSATSAARNFMAANTGGLSAKVVGKANGLFTT